MPGPISPVEPELASPAAEHADADQAVAAPEAVDAEPLSKSKRKKLEKKARCGFRDRGSLRLQPS